MNNCARIVKINHIEKHPNADNLQIVYLFGTQVITDMSAKQGDLVIYFDSNLQLSADYLKHNNLYRHNKLNFDVKKEGYFDDNGRVKAIRLRGEFSNGVLMPLKSLDFTGNIYDNNTYERDFQEGHEFTHWNNVEICSKYIVPIEIKSQGSNRNKTRKSKIKISPMFIEHWDTAQYMRNKHLIPYNTIVYIEEKIHGTSNRTGNVLIKKELSFLERLINLIKGMDLFTPTFWKIVNGTRRTIQSESSVGFHDNTMRDELKNKVAPLLYKGEEIYCEIAGYEVSGKQIQKGFSYNTEPGQSRFFLYRVSHNNEDGVIIDLSREAVYARAKELDLESPPLLTTFHYTGTEYSKKKLDSLVLELCQGNSTLDSKTLREGVVIWFMNKFGQWTCLKHKSEAFLLKESKLKDEGVGDIEDSL